MATSLDDSVKMDPEPKIRPKSSADDRIMVAFMAIIALYPILFWLMIQPFLFPLLLRTELGIIHVFRNAALLAVGNFGNKMVLLVITLISFIALEIL